MGLSMSTMRWLAPSAWALDVAAQTYGMNSSPNMLDRHNQNLSFWSPNPWMIPAFFAPQQLVQVCWLYRLLSLDSRKPADGAELGIQLDYVPVYALGNVCIGAWMLFWNANNLKGSNVFVLTNSIAQLLYIGGAVGKLGRMNTGSLSSVLTHVNAKTFAGIGVLDVLHNASAAYFKSQAPSTLVQVGTGLGFGLAGACSDWVFGSCLVYDLVALSVGQRQYGNVGWSNVLAAFAVGTAGIVGIKNWFRPPYESKPPSYDAVDVDDRV